MQEVDIDNYSKAEDDMEKVAFKQIQEVGLETLSKVDEIKKMLENMTRDSKPKTSNSFVDNNNNIENQIDVFKKSLNFCTDISAIEDFLEHNEFNVYPEDGVLACKLCFGDSEPPCNPTNHPSGIIQYSRFEIFTESG